MIDKNSIIKLYLVLILMMLLYMYLGCATLESRQLSIYPKPSRSDRL